MVRKFTTPVELPADPGSALQAATKQYVDTHGAAGTYSVTAYGAVGNGSTDDTAAINSAVAAALAAPGGVVWFPPGTYATTSVIDVPENVTLEGVHGDSIPYATSPASPCVIKPLGTHTGTAILRMRGKTETSRTYDHVGARIRNLTLDGTNTPAGTKGIQVAALVREARFEYVTVNATKDTAFWFGAGTVATTTMPQSLRLIGCLAKASGNNGYTFTNVADSTAIDCNSLGATNSGFYVAGFMNGQMANCRAEWSGQHGIYLTSGYWGSGQGSGGMNMLACSTDRNGYNGVYIDATGAAPIQLTNCVLRRDGRNGGTGGGNYAGLFVATTATMPTIVDNLHVYPGLDDDGTQTLSPQYGVSSTGSNVVVIDSGYVHAATTAINSGAGLLIDNGVGTATGTPTSPTRVAPIGDVPATRTVTAGTGLTGGGTLAADRTFAVSYGTTSGTAAQGNDSRLSDARTPTAHATTHGSGGSDPVTPAAIGAATSASTQVFATPGTSTWTKPTGATAVYILCIGGGGGGASGARAASGTAAAGGGGGCGGGWSELFIAAAQLNATETVLVGAGGAGGAGVTTGSTSTNGTGGGATAVYDAATINRTIAYGGGGGVGSGTGLGGGGIKTFGCLGGTAASGAAGNAGAGGATATAWGGAGGGAGGGMSTTAATVFNGGAGGFATNAGVAGGTGGTSGTRGGGVGYSAPSNYPTPGSGGGGGAGGGNVAGGAGGAGGKWGAGGGGGGATTTSLTSGAGGAGADGLVIITTWF